MHGGFDEPHGPPVAQVTPPIGPVLPRMAMACSPHPFGPWSSIGIVVLTWLVAFVVIVVIAVGVGIVLAVLGVRASSLDPLGPLGLSLEVLLTCVWIGGLALACRLRGWRFLDYAALIRVRFRVIALWLGLLLLFIGAEMAVNALLQRDVPEFMLEMVANPLALPVVLAVVMLVAPVVEELVFRGFLHRSLAATRAGALLAVPLTSLLWTGMHAMQYEFIDLSMLFVGGLLLGAARHVTGSVLPCIAMHGLMNAIATTALLLYVYG